MLHHTVLENGLEIIGEEAAHARSVAFGFFVRAGARDEVPAVNGVSHFLEHMVFKGTEKYSAEDVNRLFDEVGAHYNASTGEEVTMFYAAVLPEYFEQVFPLQAEILFPALRDSDFETEKQVILEEIGMYDDQPASVAMDHAMQRHFAGHPLGQVILGTPESVGALTSSQMRTYHRGRYLAGNIVLAVSGRFDWDGVVAAANHVCGNWPRGSTPREVTEPRPVTSGEWIERSHLQQQLVVRLMSAPPAGDRLRFAAEILTVIVGDDSNSRLFWELVDPGDADVAEVGYYEFEGAGIFLLYLSGEPERTTENLNRIHRVLDEVNRKGVTEDELELAKNKVGTRLVLRGERPINRLAGLGADWLLRREYRSVSDELEAVNAVTLDDLSELLARYPLVPQTTIGVGPLKGVTSP